MQKELKVTFQPSGRSVYVLPGTVLLEAAARAGHVIQTPCGGAGKCGKCLVRVASGDCKASDEATRLVGRERAGNGYRLACQCKVEDDLTVEIPESSLFQTSQKILAGGTGGEFAIRPLVIKRFVRLEPPDREQPLSDLENIRQTLGPVNVDAFLLKKIPGVLRESGFEVTATVTDNRLIALEPGNTEAECYGVAFDLGTTTVVGTLVDILTGVDVAVASMINPQTSFGDDVVSRIKKCREEKDGLDMLSGMIREALNAIVGELVRKADIPRANIYEAVVAGNTTMQEIFCGIDPRSLGELPFVAAFKDPLTLPARDLALDINHGADVHIFPQIGGFVGGDTVAGIIAARLDEADAPALLVDVGTNGEIVLANKGRLIATSVAAGPAFEGARIVNGMRATAGAIEKMVIDDEIGINVIGNTAPIGLCGTGLIDAVAGLLRCGALDPTGLLLGSDEIPSSVPDSVRKRIIRDDGQYCFVLADASESGTGAPVCLYQKDIRELQLANGAIRAGISILLKMEHLEPGDLGTVLLAGAFGNFIRRSNACRIGMLPQLPRERIRFVGNTASFGAKRVLLSSDERQYARLVTAKTRHMDLSLSPEFQAEFSNAMIFPDSE